MRSDSPVRGEPQCDGDTVLVTATQVGRPLEVLRLSGLDSAAACNLAAAIEKEWYPSEFGKLSEQVLATQIPIRPEAENVHKLLADVRVRLALLKAMVFGEIPPAEDLVPPVGVGGKEQSSKAVESFRVPSVDQVAQIAKSRYAVTGN